MLYFIALLPIIIGAIFWWKSTEIDWKEWLAGSIIGIIIALIINAIVIYGMTADVEIWSGRVDKAIFYPYWHASWTELETTTDSKGNTHTKLVHKHADYPEHWVFFVNFGNGNLDEINVSKGDFDSFVIKAHGDNKLIVEKPHKPHFDRGDPNIYIAKNNKQIIYPSTKHVSFENRIKAAPSLFQFKMLSDKEKKDLYKHPVEGLPRIIGSIPISQWEWDCLNSVVGPVKQVNLILINFGDKNSEIAHRQEALWLGGKKNDLVMCYGGKDAIEWSYCFGWTEDALIKRNLETLLLNEKIGESILPLIQQEVVKNYKRKKWKDFNYITVDVPTWAIYLQLFIMVLTQGGLYYYFHQNALSKDNPKANIFQEKFRNWRFR